MILFIRPQGGQLRYVVISGEELSIVYANRSAALYHMEDYDQTLRDISLAMQNYPKHLAHKLHERKARCHLAQKDFDEAMKSFKYSRENIFLETIFI